MRTLWLEGMARTESLRPIRRSHMRYYQWWRRGVGKRWRKSRHSGRRERRCGWRCARSVATRCNGRQWRQRRICKGFRDGHSRRSNVSVSATATGGVGGIAPSASDNAANGGSGTASAIGLAEGGNATVLATASGGAGGYGIATRRRAPSCTTAPG